MDLVNFNGKQYNGVLVEDSWGKTYLCSTCTLTGYDLGEDCRIDAKHAVLFHWFLDDLVPRWNLRDIWCALYRHARPWDVQLNRYSPLELREKVKQVFLSGDINIWQLTDGWAVPPTGQSGAAAPAQSEDSSNQYTARPAARKKRQPSQQDNGVAATTTTAAQHESTRALTHGSSAFKAASNEVNPAFKPYMGNKVFKKQHADGSVQDPYTLMADGLPQGAKEGVMPKHAKGLEEFPEEYIPLFDEGFPDVVSRNDFMNFSDIEPKVLPPGAKIYRIVDEGSSEAKGDSGCYWATELPEGKAAWRGNYAVKDSWNDNGYYVEHTVGDEGLKVWQGKTAGQEYEVHDEREFYLEGGETQLYVGYNEVPNLKPKLTNWADA